jgi:hypothetical protein
LWSAGATPAGWDTVTFYVDIDATLVTAHSDRELAAETFAAFLGHGCQGDEVVVSGSQVTGQTCWGSSTRLPRASSRNTKASTPL